MAQFEYFALGALLLPLQILAGCGSEAQPPPPDYPPTPAGAAGAVHVAAGWPDDGADGSAEHPYPTIQQGVDHAQSGGAVLVAAGTYAENVSIPKPVMVLGAPPENDASAAPVVVEAPAHFAITITSGTEDVLLRGLAVVNPIGIGVWVQSSGKATLDGMRIEGALPDGADFGYGALSTDNGALVICRSKISGSHLMGVLVSGGHGEIDRSTISGNHGRGGIRVESASGEVSIHDNEFDGNEEVAVGVYSSSALVMNNVIKNTLGSGALSIGDGVVVSRLKDANGVYLGESDVTIAGNTVKGSARVGVLFSAGARGSITGNTIADNGFGASFAAGIWAQAGAGGPIGDGLSITGNTITGNRYIGVGLTSNARAKIAENTAISGTVAADVFVGAFEWSIGDGIGVFDGSRAVISGNTLNGNERFGLILDEALASGTVEDNIISGSGQFGVVVQHQAAPDLSSNTLSGNMDGPSKVVGAAEDPFGVQKEELTAP